MSTREEYFSKKLVYLQDCYSRLQWSSGNAPTVSDISAAIKYFNKALLSIMKEVTENQKDLISVTNTTYSISSYICFNKVNYTYPCLDYFTFFNTVVSMMGKLPYLHSGHEDMSVMLMEGICLVTMFLEEKARATVPLTVAGLITELCWSTTYILIQEYIVKTLCNSILPCCLGLMTDNKNLKSCFDTLPAVISVVLDGVQNVSLHFRVIETIMLFKQDVWLDLMSVISYGGGKGKAYAVQLLFHYWPFLHSAPTEHTTPSQYSCSMVSCTNLQCKSPPNNNAATLLILDQSLSTKFANSPPPLYLCYACSQTIGHKSEVLPSLEVMLPTENISFNCENKHCLSNDPTATVILCSSQKKYLNAHNEKAVKHFSYTWNRLENRATRYCDECFCNLRNVLQHLNLITQVSPICVWETDSTTMQTVINAIESLLIETSGQTSAKYLDDDSASSIKLSKISFRDSNATTTQLPFIEANYVYPCVACCENIGGQNDLLGQFGVWLLVLLCPPKENICEKLAMQLISTILCWYGTTSCLKAGEFGSRLESLKPKYLHPWLEKMCELYSDVVVAILSPNPSQNSRVRGYWDSIQPLWKHYEDTLTLIVCLSSYSIIRLDMWKRLMPLWLAALNDNIPSADLIQLKPVLTTLLDPQLSPLSFDAKDMFGFIFNRFNQHTLLAYEDSLEWLQVLTETEVFLPLEILSSVFCDVKLVYDVNQFSESAHSLHALNVDCSFKEMKEDMTNICKLESIFESMNIVCNNSCSGRDLKDMFSSSATNDGKRSGMWISFPTAKIVKSPSFVKSRRSFNRIQAILMCIDDVIINLRSSITYIVTYSIILLFSAFDETNTAVSVKAKMVFETLSVASLQVIYKCMEHEFDESVKDRQILLTTFLRLHLVRPNTKAISFSFFSKRMDILSAEAAYYKKLGQNFPFPVGACSQKTLLNNDRLSTKVKQVHRNLHSSLPIINRLASRNGTQKSDDTSANELTLFEEQLNYNTVHQLIYAMCRYMIDCKKEEITSSKFFRVFLHQFQSIFSYSEHMSYFTCTPAVLRSCIGLSTFLLNLPLILDHNMNLGNVILPMVLSLLEHVTSSGSSTKDMELEPRSLNFLLDSCKSSWLLCIQIILYKYEVSESVQRNQLQRLMRVCLNTLESEFHGCTTDCLKIEAYSNEGDAKIRINTVSPQTTNTRKTVRDLADNEDQTFYSSSPPAYKDLDSYDSFNVNHSLSSAHQTNISDTVMKSFANLNHWNEALASGLHCNFDSNKTKQSKTNSRFDQGEATNRKVDELSQEKRRRENLSHISVRCIHCKENITESNKDTISICIVNLCQFVRFDASLAVPSIPRILAQLVKVAEPLWDENPISTTGSSAFESSAHMAKQSIRCILHQLAENHIFSRLFLVSFQSGDHFIPVLMTCLRGYSGLHHVDVLRYVLEGLPDDLSELNSTVLSRLLTNLATYLQYLPHDAPNNQWQPVVNSFALFFLKMQSYLQKFEMKSFDNLLNIMIALLNAHAYLTLKQSLLEPFSKVLTMLIPSSHFSVVTFHELCTTTNKIFNKDRDKLFITRLAIAKLIASLKLSCSISECNLLLLLQFVLLDSGSSVNPRTMFHFLSMKVLSKSKGPSYAMECMKGHLSDCLDILSDEQFLTKIADKLNNHTNCCTLDMSCTDSGRSHIKLAIAQIVAGMLCQKTLNSSFPWLFQPPSTMQYGLKEYNDCVTHIKRLSWILLGTLSHLGLQQFPERTLWQPVPFETGPNLSNILQVIFAGYLEHNKARYSSNEQEIKISMGALFYSFLFCQLWTVYCEQLSFYLPSQASSGVTGSVSIGNSYNPINEHATPAILLLEFWSRVTPSILVLLEQDGPISKNGHRHIASLIECLRKYDSSILFKLQPMWTPLLNLQPLVKKWSADELRAYHNFNSACSSSDDKQKNNSKLNSENILSIVEDIKGRLIHIESDNGLYIV
uniref:protein unc-79 homolog isoform X5 n=1 Tax=Ciona intestinalis TaxID=7719 RepID=UPI000EF52A13|nr:protein unc-79 homolog isoform X5 [Ciona intestinalis]|eukprot:XP_026693910.1 protein unc-79 homolog isoform X5 [Ciona intestinalis]